MSNDTDGLQTVPLEAVEGAFLTLAAVVLSVVAIVSNSLLIYVVVRSAAMHTSTNFFIASLSAGELVTGLFVIPFAGTAAAASSGDWAFSPDLCCFVGVMGVLGPCVSALSLLVVSADRYVAISRPLRYADLVTKTSTAFIIVFVWLLSLLLSLLPLAGWGRYRFSGSFKVCLMRSSSDSRAHVPEVVVMGVLSTFIPVTLVILIVLKTAHHIRGHRRVFAFVPVPVAVTSLPSGTRTMTASSSRVKATRTLLLVSAVFVALCVPAVVAFALCQRPSSCTVSARVLRTLLWLSFLSCIVNPIIIMTLNGKFRARLKALLCRHGQCGVWKPAPSDKDPFTITSGLQAVLDASLLVNVVHGTGQQDAKQRRHVLMSVQARAVELQAQYVFIRRTGMVTLRKTRSSPDCRVAGAEGVGS
ncbi:adenosine receptor A2b-like [Littorina saxatilis]|uniref:G-protein coupled receptors family 1 profile domain-containing protein n=1 Tax=Littorina saxatilis TaxID=31220 RepID=A0AAN9GM14_9CAEN